MKQLSGYSMAKVFFQAETALQGRAGARQTGVRQPGLNGSCAPRHSAVSSCPAVCSAPCCPSDAVPGLWEPLVLRGYHRAALALRSAQLPGAQGSPPAHRPPAADAHSHGVVALARAHGHLGGSRHGQDQRCPPRSVCDQAAPGSPGTGVASRGCAALY